jgi:hypothetical protein
MNKKIDHNIVYNHEISNSIERELYERQITTLQEENKYLKMMLEKVLLTSK